MISANQKEITEKLLLITSVSFSATHFSRAHLVYCNEIHMHICIVTEYYQLCPCCLNGKITYDINVYPKMVSLTF